MTHTLLGSTSAAVLDPALSFDATYGYDLEALLAVRAPTPPADLADFWHGLKAVADRVDLAPLLGPGTVEGGWRIHDVAFTSIGGVRIGGWLVLPADGDVRAGMVVSHGYGGRDEPDPSLLPPRTAGIYPCARGLPTRSLIHDVPPEGAGHVLVGIDDRRHYIHGGCAADIWCAASALTAVVPAVAGPLAYWGGSFGGGIGPLALHVDDRFGAAVLEVPSFGHHPLRLTMPCQGSGESVRGYAARHPEVIDTLRYFDAATCAARISIPVLVAPALADPAVPPPGQFAVANAFAGPTTVFVTSAGHAEYPGQDTEAAEVRRHADDLLTGVLDVAGDHAAG